MQYKIGTVTTTNGSQVITGVGTLWLANIVSGALFTVPGDNVTYEIASVDTDTQVTLSANYAGTGAAGVTYAMHRDFTSGNIPLLSNNDIETGTIFSRAMAQIQDLISTNEKPSIVDNGTATILTLSAGGGATFSGDINLSNNKRLYLGNSNEGSIRHDGSTKITNAAGNIEINENVNSGTITLQSLNSSAVNKVSILVGGATPYVGLYYDGAEVMRTVLGGINLQDNKHVYLGNSNDLDIHHTGSGSNIIGNTGNLNLRALSNSNLVTISAYDSAGIEKDCMTAGGATPYVGLYYDGAEVFHTVNGGIEHGTFSDTGVSDGIHMAGNLIKTSTTSTGSTNHVLFYNPNGNVGAIQTSTTATAFITSSDKRLKTSHGLLSNAVDIVNQIEIHEFHFDTDPKIIHHGVMAQDCFKVYPNAISKPKKEAASWGADYSKLVPIMLANIQELNNIVLTGGSK